TPEPLPFEFGDSIQDPAPSRIAVNAAGDVVVLTDKNLQLLRKGDQKPTVIDDDTDKRFLAVDPKGAIYFIGGFDDVKVLDSGATEARTFEEPDKADPTKEIAAMAFDTNGDRYTVYQGCGPNQPEGQIRPCNTYVYSLTKVTGNTGAPKDI